MPATKLRIEGLPELIKKLDGRTWLSEPLRQAMREGGELMKDEARRRAPESLGSAVELDVLAGQRAVMGMVKLRLNSPKNPRGLPYGNILNSSRKARWRKGPRVRARTKAWFHGIVRLKRVKTGVDRIFQRAMKEVERNWQR